MTGKISSDKHLFAIYRDNLSLLTKDLQQEESLKFQDKELVQRITQILRLNLGDKLILFDSQINLELELLEISKKNISGKILNIKNNKILQPKITLSLGLLKKNFFEQVLYYAAAMGASIVQPVLSQKVHKNWLKDKERLVKIMIAGCEQAKNFVIPELLEPVSLNDFINNKSIKDSKKILFDPDGNKLLEILQSLDKEKKDLTLLFGPESGFSDSELDLLKSNNFELCALTPTILRAVEAVAVGLGAVRSCPGANGVELTYSQ